MKNKHPNSNSRKFDPQTRWVIGISRHAVGALGLQGLISEFAVRTIPYSQFKVHLARREVVEAPLSRRRSWPRRSAGRARAQRRAG